MGAKIINKLQLITFDATGTLIKFRVNPAIQYVKVGNLYGVKVSVEKISSNFKNQWHEMNRTHPIFGRLTGLGWEQWWHTLVCKTFQSSVIDVQPSTINAIAYHLIDGYRTGEYYDIYPGTKYVLNWIKNQGVALGIISNFDVRLPHVLKDLGLMQYFQFVITSYEVGVQKPDSKIFQHALECCGDLSPKLAFHVGNEPELDYLAAKKSGWNAALVHVDKSNVIMRYPQIPKHLLFDDLSSLMNYML